MFADYDKGIADNEANRVELIGKTPVTSKRQAIFEFQTAIPLPHGLV
jgi:hypothetical protein